MILRAPFTAVAGLLLLPALATAQEATDSARAAEVRQTAAAFHAALAAGDSVGALALLHPEATIYEGGHAETVAEYRAGHLASDIAFAAAVRREITREEIVLRGDAAAYMSESRTTGRWRGRDIDGRGTETILLVRTPAGWRIRHIHWSSR